MGALRVLLAISVVSEHSGRILGIQALPGFLAVELFYVISGFYMGLILTEKYQRAGGWKIFYVNRALRLLPIYYFVFALTLLLCSFAVLRGEPLPPYLGGFAQADRLSPGTLAAVTLPNLSLAGLDILHFLHVTPDGGLAPSLQPPTTLFDPNAAGRWFTAIPQAWTLGIEVEFYLLAPWLARRRTRSLVVLLLVSATMRAVFYRWGYAADPWSDRFFPFELALFVAGLIAYRAHRWLAQPSTPAATRALTMTGRVSILTAIAVIMIFANASQPADFASLGHGPAANWLLIAGITVLLPFIFLATRRSRLDNAIGQYSYPIYICHFIFISFFGVYLQRTNFAYGISVVLLSALLSALLLRASRGVERFRAREAVLAMEA
jgi:peptidoglycan/LPS O-acetylase OafA/YrhL